jgi:serine/threonine protein kinase
MESKKFGDYTILEKLGEGSFGKVFKASKFVKCKKEFFAIKAISKKNLVSKNAEYFKRELAILQKISHEYIIKFYEHLENVNFHFIITEYAYGMDLGELNKAYVKKNNKNLPELYIQLIIKQISSALYYLFKQNIIHRDIKLENILFTFPNENAKKDLDILSGCVKIIDFGLARPFDTMNIMNSIVGSPITMAPQILNNVNKNFDKNFSYDYKTDIWSLGTILYQLVTNEFPFDARNIDDLQERIDLGNYYIKEKLNLSFELISLIDGLLQYNPVNRLSWEEIVNHPFLKTKNFNTLYFKNLDRSYIDNDKLILNVHKRLNINFKNKEKDNEEMEETSTKIMNTFIKIQILQKLENEKQAKNNAPNVTGNTFDDPPLIQVITEEKEEDEKSFHVSSQSGKTNVEKMDSKKKSLGSNTEKNSSTHSNDKSVKDEMNVNTESNNVNETEDNDVTVANPKFASSNLIKSDPNPMNFKTGEIKKKLSFPSYPMKILPPQSLSNNNINTKFVDQNCYKNSQGSFEVISVGVVNNTNQYENQENYNKMNLPRTTPNIINRMNIPSTSPFKEKPNSSLKINKLNNNPDRTALNRINYLNQNQNHNKPNFYAIVSNYTNQQNASFTIQSEKQEDENKTIDKTKSNTEEPVPSIDVNQNLLEENVEEDVTVQQRFDFNLKNRVHALAYIQKEVNNRSKEKTNDLEYLVNNYFLPLNEGTYKSKYCTTNDPIYPMKANGILDLNM